MSRKEIDSIRKMSRKDARESVRKCNRMIEFNEVNKNKECAICGTGVEVALFEIHQISDGKYVSDGNTLILCNRDIEMLFDGEVKHSFIDLFNFWLGNYELPNTEKNLDEHDLTSIPNDFVEKPKSYEFNRIVTVCDKCGESLDLGIDSGISKIPFEGTWSCKCGNLIKTKWNGTELEYL